MTVFDLPKSRNVRFTNTMTRNGANSAFVYLAFAQLAVPDPAHNEANSLTWGVWQTDAKSTKKRRINSATHSVDITNFTHRIE